MSLQEESIQEPDEALPELALEALPAPLREACARAGWTELMPVQRRAIPYLLAGRDLMVQSRTGSGKTGAFVLPALEIIDRARNACQILTLVPTRELARQVARDAALLAGKEGPGVAAIYGGVGYGSQRDALRRGAQIVVGTPGRVLDHLLRRTFTLDGLKMLVFDEADRMLSMGFYPDMVRVRRYLPDRAVRGYMFSATFPPHVLRLAGQFLERPEILSLSRDHVHVTDTVHVYYKVPALEKDRCLVRILEVENPTGALIFCNTKAKVHYVAVVLRRFGYDADELSADLAQKAREKVLQRVREGKLRLLVATDVAARGIDIPDLSHVIQYEPPEDPEGYIHRAGRTGRAGATGRAICLVDDLEGMTLRKIAKRYTIDLQERPVPDDAAVAGLVGQRLTALLEARLRELDQVQKERLGRFQPLARSLGEDEEASALLALLLDDFYHGSLRMPPEPPPKKETSSPPRRRSRGRSRGRRSR